MNNLLKNTLAKAQNHPILSSIILISLAVLAFYANSFTADWHYDDFHHIKENINIRKFSNIPNLFKDPTTFSRNPNTRTMRPLLMTTHALNYQVGLLTSRDGYDVVGYHIVNFLFHLLATIVLFLIIRHLFQHNVPIQGIDPVYPALFGALLFGINTINSETVVYISSRSASMASMFFFLAFYGYMKATDGERINGLALTLSGLAYIGGLLTKEIAITLPAALFLYEWLLGDLKLTDIFKKSTIVLMARRWWLYALISVGYLYYRHVLLNENLYTQVVSKGGTQAAPNLISQLATQSRVWVFYVREWLLPTGLSIDKPFPVSHRLTEPKVVLCILIILATAAAAVMIRKRHPMVSFGILFWMVTLLPESLIRLNVVLNDHRLYLPGLGGTLIFVYLSTILYIRLRADHVLYRRVLISTIATMLLLMGLGTLKRNAAFATEETIWKDVILKDRKSVRGYNNLGIYYEQHLDYDKALRYYNQTIRLAPMFPNPYINIGNVYHKQKKFEQAEKYMKRAIQLGPRSALATYNLGNILREAGKTKEAVNSYKRAIELNPRYIEAANNLANIFFKTGDYNQAIKYYQRALFIDPTFAMSYYNIGLSYQKMGNYKESIPAFREFLRYWTGDEGFRRQARGRIESMQRLMR